MEGSCRQTLREAWGAAALLLATAVPFSAVSALAAPAAASRHVQAELVSEVESIQPGQPFWLGLHLKMEPGWHTYWKNPGDSGLPTRLTWKLPDGFEAAPIEWPYPKPFSQGPVTSYGYERDVLLPVRVTPRASLTPGQPVTLAARADWLECREQCLPGRAELKVTLPVAASAPRPVAALAAVFAQTRKKLPAVPAGWTFEAAESGTGLQLQLRPPKTWGTIEQAYFFSEQPEVVDYAAAQALASAPNGYRLDLATAPNVARPLVRLRGVLVTTSAEGGTCAVRVEAPVVKKIGGLRPTPEGGEAMTIRAKVLAAVVLAAAAVPATARAAAVVGQPAPDFTLVDTSGAKHSLSDLKGKMVVLEWVNFECPFVGKHYGSGNMQKLQKAYTGKGVVWLSINSSAEGKQGYFPPDKINALMKEKGAAPSAYLIDTDGRVGRAYGAKTTPHMFVVDPRGAVVYAGGIDDTPSTDQADIATAKNYVRAALDEALAGKPVTAASSAPYGCSVKYR